MSKRKLVLTTVGISVLLNSLASGEDEWRRRLNRESNSRDLSQDISQKVGTLTEQALDTLRRCDVKKNRALSAELNGLYSLYQDQLVTERGDMHWLIATDTAMGRKSVETINTFLQEQGLTSSVYIPAELSTAEPASFSKGIKDLIRWCEDTIPGYHEAGYQVIFNLTGAFKSLQGYLNIAGMFYADEIVYIFETGSKLVSIPRLPLRVDIDALREYRVELALMSQGHVYVLEQIAGIPAGLLDVDEKDMAWLSDWGTLIWNRARKELLGDDLLPFPRLQYTDTFRREFKQASSTERAELQETLAKVSGLLEDHQGNTSILRQDGGLQYDNYTGKTTQDNRPIGHFRVSQGRRVSCTIEDGALRLRRYGEHAINNNP